MKLTAEKKSFLLLCRLLFISMLLTAFFLGCSKPPPATPGAPKPYKVFNKWYQPISSAHGLRQKGVASWYGKDFHGKKTSNGETYNMYAMTAAHKTLPFGVHVNVKNLDNNLETVVRINDRGPFVGTRIIDLSYTAAKKLAVVGPGTARVEIIALGASKTKKSAPDSAGYTPVNYESGNFTFQVGAFKDFENADRLRKELDESHENAHISVFNNGQETYYRVRVGKYTNLQQILKDEAVMIQKGFKNAFIVAE
jgi:rare lipoprotein A